VVLLFCVLLLYLLFKMVPKHKAEILSSVLAREDCDCFWEKYRCWMSFVEAGMMCVQC
jgi:hypothetical protein